MKELLVACGWAIRKMGGVNKEKAFSLCSQESMTIWEFETCKNSNNLFVKHGDRKGSNSFNIRSIICNDSDFDTRTKYTL